MADDADNERTTDSDPRVASEADETRDVDQLFDDYSRRGVTITLSESSDSIIEINGHKLSNPIRLDTTPDTIRAGIEEFLRELQEGKITSEEKSDKQVESGTRDSVDSGSGDVGDSTDNTGTDNTPSPEQHDVLDIYQMQLLKNEFGPRAIFRNSINKITHVDGVELKKPISLNQDYASVRSAIESEFSSSWTGEDVSLKKRDDLTKKGSEQLNMSGLVDQLKGGGRKLILAPSGTGKSTLVKRFGLPFVDLDQIMDWPDNVAVPQWWTDPKLAELVNGELARRITEWLKRDGTEIGLYADTIGGKLKPDVVIIPSLEDLKKNLASRDKEQGVGLQPGVDDIDRILKNTDELKQSGGAIFNSFDQVLGINQNDNDENSDTKEVSRGTDRMGLPSEEDESKVDTGGSRIEEKPRCPNCRQPEYRQGGGSTCRCQ
jgi:hypothetical protein